MLVDKAARIDPAVVGAERRHQETGLEQEAPGSAIEVRARLELVEQETLERVDRAALAPELIVEGQQRRDDAGPQAERRNAAGGPCFGGRGGADNLPLNRG